MKSRRPSRSRIPIRRLRRRRPSCTLYIFLFSNNNIYLQKTETGVAEDIKITFDTTGDNCNYPNTLNQCFYENGDPTGLFNRINIKIENN